MGKKLVTLLEKKDIIGLCVMLVVIAALLLCLAPWPTRVNVSLNATKVDQGGNAIGTANIHIDGFKLNYLFKMDRMDISISPFGNFKYFKLSTLHHNNTQTLGAIQAHPGGAYYYISIGGWDTQANDLFFGYLLFSENMDRWMLCENRDGSGLCYVGSVNENDTSDLLWDYFSG